MVFIEKLFVHSQTGGKDIQNNNIFQIRKISI